MSRFTRSLLDVPQRVIQYIGRAVSRIFGPNDDQYPETGVQPFEGEVPQHKRRNSL